MEDSNDFLLMFHAPSCSVICKSCRVSFTSLAKIRKHMNEEHGTPFRTSEVNAFIRRIGLAPLVAKDGEATPGAKERICIPMKQLPRCLNGTAPLTGVQKHYWCESNSCSDKQNRVLQQIPYLNVTMGFRCGYSNCLYCCETESGMRTHYSESHFKEKSKIPPKACHMQRVGTNKFFPISFLHEENDNNTLSYPKEERKKYGNTSHANHVKQHGVNRTAPGTGENHRSIAGRSQKFTNQCVSNDIGETRREVQLRNDRDDEDQHVIVNKGVPRYETNADSVHQSLDDKKHNPYAQNCDAENQRSIEITGNVKDAQRDSPFHNAGVREERFSILSKAANGTGQLTDNVICDMESGRHLSEQFSSSNRPSADKNMNTALDTFSSCIEHFTPLYIYRHTAKSADFEEQQQEQEAGIAKRDRSINEIEKDFFAKKLDIVQRLQDLGFRKLSDVPVELLVNPCSTQQLQSRAEFGFKLAQLGTSLIEEIGFDESILSCEAEWYLDHSRSLCRKSAGFISRMVCTTDLYTPNNDESFMRPGGVTRSQRLRFQPISSKKTKKQYAAVLSRLVLFVLRLVAIKHCVAPHANGNNVYPSAENFGMQFRRVPFIVEDKIRERYAAVFNNIPHRLESAVLHYIAQFRITSTALERLGIRKPSAKPMTWKEQGKATSDYIKLCINGFHKDRSERSKLPDVGAAMGEVRSYLTQELQKRFHEIVKEILLQQCDETTSTYHLFMSTFLSVLCVTECNNSFYRLKKAYELSPTLAALLYSSSCCGVVEACQSSWTERDEHYNTETSSKERLQDTISILEDVKKEMFTVEDIRPDNPICKMTHENIRSRYRQDRNNAVSVLRDWMSTSMLIQSSDKGNVRLSWCIEHPNCAFIDGRECSIEMVNEAVQSMQTELRQILNNELTFGASISSHLWSKLTKANDDYRIVGVGKSFLSSKDNRDLAEETSRLILRHLLNDKVVMHRFFDIVQLQDGIDSAITENNANKYNALQACVRVGSLAVQNYLAKCEEATELAVVLIHICGGSPARAKELETYLFSNSESLSRSFFVEQGRVVLLAGYSKNDWRSLFESGIWRQMDRETSRLLLLFFAVVRPFQELLLLANYRSESCLAVKPHMFLCSDGKPFDARRITAAVTKHFACQKLPYTFSQYRHWQCSIVKRFSSDHGRKLLLLLDNGEEDYATYCFTDGNMSNAGDGTGSMAEFMHLQAGHNVITASRKYAQHSGVHQSLDKDKKSKFMIASQAWHAILKLQSDWSYKKVSFHEIGNEERDTSVDLARQGARSEVGNGLCVNEIENSNAQKRPSPNIPLEELISNRSPIQHGLQSKKQKVAHPFVAPQAVNNKSGTPLSALQDNLSITPHISCLNRQRNGHELFRTVQEIEKYKKSLVCLRKALRDETAMFKSEVQAQAIQEVGNGDQDVVIVMGTGEGKSLVYQVPALLNGTDDCVFIVVVPLLALMKELQSKSRGRGLRVGCWHTRGELDYDIIYVTPERVSGLEFEPFIANIVCQRRKVQVIVEECHLTLLWSSFRPAMESLRMRLSNPCLPMRKVVLSATIPPLMEDRVARAHGLSPNYRVIRKHTVRLNLSYEVKTVNSTKFKSVSSDMVKATVNQVMEEIETIIRDADTRLQVGTQILSERQQIVIYCPSCSLVDEIVEKLLEEDIYTSMLDAETETAKQCNGKKLSVPQRRGSMIVVFEFPLSYYARMKREDRERNQKNWVQGIHNIQSLASKSNDCKWKAVNNIHTAQQESSEDKEEAENNGAKPVKKWLLFQVMAATSAFGTGIDSPFVRSVLHVGFSRSVVEYIQESGRAGRDGEPARCVLLFNEQFLNRYARVIGYEPPDSVLLMINESTSSPSLPRSCDGIGKELGLRKDAAVSYIKTEAVHEILSAEYEWRKFCSWARSTLFCRRQTLFAEVDVEVPEPCFVNKNGILCDICRAAFCSTNLPKARTENQNRSVHPQSQELEISSKPVRSEETSHDNFPGGFQLLSKQEEKRLFSLFKNEPSHESKREKIMEMNAVFWNVLQKLRNRCLVCYVEGHEAHHSEGFNSTGDTKCFKKFRRCFKCLRQHCNGMLPNSSCPILGEMRQGTERVMDTNNKRRDSEGLSMNVTLSIKPQLIRTPDPHGNELWRKRHTNCCYGCGLPFKFEASDTHPGRDQLGSRCLVKACLKVCIAVWCNEVGRSWIIEEFKLSRDLHENTVRSTFAFLTWLREPNSERTGFNVMELFPKLWERMGGW